MEHSDRLTATERRIAEVLAGEPQTIAFGTVAQVAERAGTSGPSVVRLAVKLGYEGFVALQAAVQQELARQLGPAHDRIRQRPPTDLLSRVMETEQDNVTRTFAGISAEVLERVVSLLADRRRHVWVLPGDVTLPVGLSLSSQLSQLREGVSLLGGSEAAIGRSLGGAESHDVLVAVDIRRYERSLVSTVQLARDHGMAVVAITDSPLSPLAARGAMAFFVAASGVGPFDSMTGALCLANLLVGATAARLRQGATRRLDAIEDAWGALSALVAEPGGSEPLTAGLLEAPAGLLDGPTGADGMGPGGRGGDVLDWSRPALPREAGAEA
ncbi:MurR/RpiR family transcriptional regulator [Acidiferrimicrobium sp. IK]|nr:MurR/RpiR family transcriptional regulator [Acidiferrimicrobium sp. IK]